MVIYVEDGSALASDGSAALEPEDPDHALKVSINGAAPIDAVGTFYHVGDGEYVYEFALSEVGTPGFVAFIMTRAGYLPQLAWLPVGQIWSPGETDTTLLRFPLALRDEDNNLIEGAVVESPEELQVSINGGNFADSLGELHELIAGFYYYQGVAADAAVAGFASVKFEKAGYATQHIYTDVEDTSSGTSGSVIEISSGSRSRWSPVNVKLQINDGALFVRYVSNSLVFWLYDPVDGFKNNFRERSSVTVDGDNYVMSILPNGGWWTDSFSLKFIAGIELDQG